MAVTLPPGADVAGEVCGALHLHDKRPVPSSRLMSRLRLANLSYAQLLEIAVDACESSPELKNKADALIAQVAPLPSWCVDVLLSPDLLPQLFSSLGLSEHAAAGVCTTWSRAYSRQLRRCGYIDPRSVRELADVPKRPGGLCMLPGGVLALSSLKHTASGIVKFVAARNDSDLQALAACRASSLAAKPFDWPLGLALTNDGLLVCNMGKYSNSSIALLKFAKGGSMDELATVPVLADRECAESPSTLVDRGFLQCAVHQQTQRTYAIAGANGDHSAVVLLDANLQVVAIVEDVDAAQADELDPIQDLAVHGDQVIVLTRGSHPKGSGLRLLDLDGRFLRTVAAAQFHSPQAVTASHGRAFVVDEVEHEKSGALTKDLLVIDIQSGDILQRVRVDLNGGVSGILVEGNELYIADYDDSRIVVLQLAGSEA